MTDEKRPASKVSAYYKKTEINDIGRGTDEVFQLDTESQTDDGAWDLFKKLKEEMNLQSSKEKAN